MKMPGGNEIERLYDEHAQPLYAFLLNFTRDKADTRDLLQEIFVKLAREPKLLAGVREERAFLIRLAHNAAIDLMRRRGTRDKTKENFAAEMISPFAPTNDPDEKIYREELDAGAGRIAGGTARCGAFEAVGRFDIRGNCRRAGNSAEHRRQPVSLRLDKLREPAASTLRGNEVGDDVRSLKLKAKKS